MKKCLLLIVIIPLIFLAFDDPNKLCMENLEGTWKVTKINIDRKNENIGFDMYFRFGRDGRVMYIENNKIFAEKYKISRNRLRMINTRQQWSNIGSYKVTKFEENRMVFLKGKIYLLLKRIDKKGIEDEEFFKYFDGRDSKLSDEKKFECVENDIKTLAGAIVAYYADYEQYPGGDAQDMIACISVLHLEYPPESDIWGHSWIYNVDPDNQGYTLRCNGRDGVPGPGELRKPDCISKDDPLRFDYDVVIINGRFAGQCK